jgi:predicted transposase/invertase (TIGR01784 family)
MKKNVKISETLPTLNPMIDLIFRILFSKEIDCLKDLINKIVFQPKGQEIVHLEILDPHLLPKVNKNKLSVMDIKATTKDGHRFNIEMQNRYHSNYKNRALFYWSQFYTEDLKQKETYNKLIPTISIHILNFNLFKSSHYHNEFAILNTKDHEPLTDHFQMHFIELLKSPVSLKGDKDPLAPWLLFLKNPQANYMEAIMRQNPMIEKANSKLKELSADKRIRALAQAREKAERDYLSDIENALLQGEAKGKAEGLIVLKNALKQLLKAKNRANQNLPKGFHEKLEKESDLVVIQNWMNKLIKDEKF